MSVVNRKYQLETLNRCEDGAEISVGGSSFAAALLTRSAAGNIQRKVTGPVGNASGFGREAIYGDSPWGRAHPPRFRIGAFSNAS
jgi:hypothetical protein